MVAPASARRGQPLIALSAVLLGWTAVRMLVWTPLFEPVGVAPATKPGATVRPRQAAAAQSNPDVAGVVARAEAVLARKTASWRSAASEDEPDAASFARNSEALFDLAKFSSFSRPMGKERSRGASLMGALPDASLGRWSADGWLLLRGRGGDSAQAPGAASYGASQAGAVLRYRLGDRGAASPYVYLRGSLAVDAPGRDREAALGLGVRPVARIPLRALVEVRAQDSALGSARMRPVVAVVTELPWQHLPLGLRGEVYAQAGYAGGREGTAFFDAQALVDRPIARLVPEAPDLRVGAGAWAGGQKGAVRLDVGPRISIGLDPGGGSGARLAIDWRFRVGGNARPGSGPALTLASSF